MAWCCGFNYESMRNERVLPRVSTPSMGRIITRFGLRKRESKLALLTKLVKDQ